MVTVFYNTLSRKKEEFRPLRKGEVRMYTCGPTVYNYLHIGNYKAAVFYDLIKKYLVFKGYRVKHAENITDVDDKTIRASREQGITLKELTEKYSEDYFENRKRLRLMEPTKQIRATESIKPMVEMVKSLLNKGYAYRGEDGSIYFSIEKFKEYGKLSGIKKDELVKGKRVSHDEYTKENPADFALWKAWSEEDGSVFWETELGKGRPGWHIECSAMSCFELECPFDIHAGGEDLIFPHHENEIAQSEAATGKKFVNYWMHESHILVDGKKMSKSLGNFYTLNDLKEFNPLAVKLSLIIPHYRTQVNFTKDGLKEKEKMIESANSLVQRLGKANGKEDMEAETARREFTKAFEGALDDDLNTPLAFSSFHDFQNKTNRLLDKGMVSKKASEGALEALKRFDSVFSFMDFGKRKELSEETTSLVKRREELRKQKMFEEADAIRKELEEKGIVLKDQKDGTTEWSCKN